MMNIEGSLKFVCEDGNYIELEQGTHSGAGMVFVRGKKGKAANVFGTKAARELGCALILAGGLADWLEIMPEQVSEYSNDK